MPFYRPVHTGPLAELVSCFFAAALGANATITVRGSFSVATSCDWVATDEYLDATMVTLGSNTALIMHSGNVGTDESGRKDVL
jgi:hypothetical protein